MGFLRRAPWISEGPEIAVQSRIGNYTSYAMLRLDPAHVDPNRTAHGEFGLAKN